MKTPTKIAITIGAIILALIIMYFLIPIKAWKKYKAEHPSLFEVNDENTPTFRNFCKSYWNTFGKVGTEREDEITYDGGELPKIDVPIAPLPKQILYTQCRHNINT